MDILEQITSNQPTPKELDDTPYSVRKYIKALEAVLIEHIIHGYSENKKSD